MTSQHPDSAQRAETHSTARIYTNPELREQLKSEIMASDQGGAPGEWSARKAQLLAHEYRQAGGGYTFAKRHSAQQHSQGWPSAQDQPQTEPTADATPHQSRQSWTAFAPNQSLVGPRSEPTAAHPEQHSANTPRQPRPDEADS